MQFASPAVAVTVFKICTRQDWLAANDSGIYAGSADDARDGFIHLSTVDQLAGTLARHFVGRDDLLLIAFPAASLGDALRWGVSRGGELFPHLYAPLPISAASGQWAVARGPSGEHVLPKLIEASGA